MRYTKLFLYLSVCLVAFFFANYTYALTITPVRLELSGDPGETIIKKVTLINEQKVPVTFYSSFANFEAQGETGNPSFVEPKDDLGTWIKTDESINLSPGESKDVNLIINIPKDAYAGGHFAVVFFGTNSNNGENNGVGIGAKTGILILLSVKGNVLEAGGLLDFKLKDNKIFYNSLPVSFIYRFKNDGDDRIKPAGNIIIHSLFYLWPGKINANSVSGNILPHSTRKFDVTWIKKERPSDYITPSNKFVLFFDNVSYEWSNFAIGPYFAKVDLVYGKQGIHTTKNLFFFVFPWQLFICLVLAFAVLFLGGRKGLKKYNKHIIEKARLGFNTPNDANHV